MGMSTRSMEMARLSRGVRPERLGVRIGFPGISQSDRDAIKQSFDSKKVFSYSLVCGLPGILGAVAFYSVHDTPYHLGRAHPPHKRFVFDESDPQSQSHASFEN